MAPQLPTIIAPDLPATGDLRAFAEPLPITETEYLEFTCHDVDWTEASVSGVVFDAVEFQRASLARTKMRNTKLRDVSVVRSDFSNADWTGASFRCVEISSTRLTGFNGTEGQYRDVLFRKCAVSHAVFHSSTFDRCRFEQCDLTEATFEGAVLKGVSFRDCKMINTRLIGGQLAAVDLRGSDIHGIQVQVERLQGVTIDVLQTAVIAELTGVNIERLPDSPSDEAEPDE